MRERWRGPLEAVVAAALLILCLPILLVGAIGSALTLRAWPFFTHDRIGMNGRRFRCIKLRTLPRHTPRFVDKDHLDRDAIPRFTRLLRLLHIDELPQLLLVVSGRMSLVGPRPEMPFLHDMLDPSFAVARTQVRPGCTGLWQVGEHCHRLIGEHPEYDEFYVRHRSIRLDAWILARTIRKVLPIRNHLVQLTDVPEWATVTTSRPRLAGDFDLNRERLEVEVVEV